MIITLLTGSFLYLGCATDTSKETSYTLKINTENNFYDSSSWGNVQKFLMVVDGKEIGTYWSINNEYYKKYCVPPLSPIHSTSLYTDICKKSNKITKNIKNGSIVELFLRKNISTSENDYKKQSTVLGFKHNIPNNSIMKNTISSNLNDRLSPMYLKFKMTKNIDMDMILTKPIGVGTSIFCYDKEYNYLKKLYTLNKDFEKENLILTVSGRQRHLTFNLKDIEEKELLAECYDESLDVKYKAIVHLTKDEFWNYLYEPPRYITRDIELPNYEISYMTDFYYKAYIHFRKQELPVSESKSKAEAIVRSIFKDYPQEWGIGYSPSLGKEEDTYDEFWNQWNTELDILKNKTSMSNSEIFNELEKYLLYNDKNINNDIKAHFFFENLQAIANEHTTEWYQVKSIKSENTGGTIQVVTKENKEFLIIDFTSNRTRSNKASFVALVQDIHIQNLNSKKLYFRTSIQRLEGIYGVSTFGYPNCTGIAGFWLEYFDINNQIKGSSLFVNMESYPKGISNRTILWIEIIKAISSRPYLGILGGDYTGLTTKDNRNIIFIDNTKQDLTININQEINKISSTNRDDITMIRINIFATDFFTLGSANTCSSKAFVEISEAGIYEMKD